MELDDELFAMSPRREMRFCTLGELVPVLLVDNFYERPDDIREQTLRLPFETAPLHYPGRIAVVPGLNSSLHQVLAWTRHLANTVYLGFSTIWSDGRPITEFRSVVTDFAVVDTHPRELTRLQRLPHVDPVPLFGLVYLNREERGGTLFFEQTSDTENFAIGGYFSEGTGPFRLLGRIDPKFNRLAIYPGCFPHSGEIVGKWIEGQARFNKPRLTQRLLFQS